MNSKILILFYSLHGATRQLAELIAEGVESAGGESLLRTVPAVAPATGDSRPGQPPTLQQVTYCSHEDLQQCDGLLIGSPTRFGNMAAPMKYFLDSTAALWMNGALVNKPAAVFTSTSSMHGGQEATLLSMMLPLLHHGAVLAGLPYSEPALNDTRTGGTPYGVSHYAGPKSNEPISQEEKALCLALGKRIANLACRLKTG